MTALFFLTNSIQSTKSSFAYGSYKIKDVSKEK